MFFSRSRMDAFLIYMMLLGVLECTFHCKAQTGVQENPNWKKLPGKLTQLDISPLDSIWGVNNLGLIYIFDENGKGWKQVAGSLKHVSAGESGVWGVNQRDKIYYRTGITLDNLEGTSWLGVPGTLHQIDSGPYGIVYGVNKEHGIYCRSGISSTKPTGTSWTLVHGALKYVSCGPFGCWGVNNNDHIYFREGITPAKCKGVKWTRIPGGLKQLEVDGYGRVYGINSHKQLYVRDGVTPSKPTGTSWRRIPSATYVHVSAGSSKVMIIDSCGSAIYYFEGKWSRIPGALIQIDSGLTAAVWGVSVHDSIYRLKDAGSWEKIPGHLKHVSVGEAGVWGVNDGDEIYYRDGVTATAPSGNSWRKISGKLKQIDSGPNQIVYGVNTNDQIFCRTGIDPVKPFGTGWKQISGSLKYISCGALGCWGINSRNSIYFRHGVSRGDCAGKRWTQVTYRTLKQIEVGANGDVYGVDKNGNVYRRVGVTAATPLGGSWEMVSKSASHVSTGNNGQYMLVNGIIFKSTGCPRKIP